MSSAIGRESSDDDQYGRRQTAFLQGDSGESERNVYGDLPSDAKQLFGLSEDEIIKLEGSVDGLRTAPKAWLAKVVADLTRLGATQHPLDQCVFMFTPNPESWQDRSACM